MSDAFDRSQSQYERKLARQKQLDMMEAAASGQAYEGGTNSPGGSVHSRASRGASSSASASIPPEGAIESARRFLWDEDEDDYTKQQGAPVMASAYDMYGAGDQGQSLMGGQTDEGLTSRIANTIRGSFMFAKSPDEEDQMGTRNIAPRRHSMMTGDAQSREGDEYIDKRKRGIGFFGAIGDCCLAIYHTIVGTFAVCCEHFTACLANINWRLCCLIISALSGVALFAFGIAAIVRRAQSEGASASNTSQSLPPVKDTARYNGMRDVILGSKFTSIDSLDTPGTPQNYALRWLSEEDPAKLEVDDDSLLQRYGLATFYFSTYVYAEIVDSASGTSGGGWKYMDYWMSDKGYCMWFGVSCPPHLFEGREEVQYNENSVIMRLNLTENDIRGFIPSEIAALENLVSLDLGTNKLSGTIPKSIAGMLELKELYLEDNLLSGTIHKELGNLKTARDLFLGTNQFTGTIPAELGKLTELRAIGLDENLLVGTIPDLWHCTNLLILYIDSNHLTGTLSPKISSLVQLIDLRVRKNALNGSIPEEINGMSHLELLYLDDNDFTGSIPATWDAMTRLEEIQLYKNRLTGVLPDSMHTLRDLKVLYLDNNNIVGTLPDSYGDLHDLYMLYLFNNKLTGTIPVTFGNMDDLRDFQVYNNSLTGSIPSELGKCYKMEKFEAQDNKLSGRIPSELGAIENLKMLKLYRNNLTGLMPSEICAATRNFQLGFVAADCSKEEGGTVDCDCCVCYP